MHTITFNHEWFDNIVSHHLEVGVANPVTDSGLGSSKEVIDDGNLMTEEHKAVNEMGADKSSATGDKDPLALRGRKQLDGGEARKSGVRNGVSGGHIDRLGLVGGVALVELGVLSLLLFILHARSHIIGSLDGVVGPQIQGTKDINRDLAVEAEAIEANGQNLVPVFIEGANLRGRECQ